MNPSSPFSRFLARLLLLSLTSFVCFAPASQAAIIGTGEILNTGQAQTDRARLTILLERAELREQLRTAGVDPTRLQARVANLSDAEVATLIKQLDQLPAGSGILGTALFIFLVLLATDILGYTEIFPFVKKTVN